MIRKKGLNAIVEGKLQPIRSEFEYNCIQGSCARLWLPSCCVMDCLIERRMGVLKNSVSQAF